MCNKIKKIITNYKRGLISRRDAFVCMSATISKSGSISGAKINMYEILNDWLPGGMSEDDLYLKMVAFGLSEC